MTFTLTNASSTLPGDSLDPTFTDSSDIDPDMLIQIHLPAPLIGLALTSIIPLGLNIIYLICWFKYPSIRRTLGDIFCFLSLLFSLKDLSEMALGIISMAVPADSQKLNHFLCQWTTHTNLINYNFVYCYSIALTIHLAQVTRGSGLDTGHKSIWYHLTIWVCAIAAYLATFFLGTMEQDIFGRCMHSIGLWNYLLPGIFTCSLIFSLYTIIRVHRREGLLKQLRTIRFLRSFKVYLLLSCLFIVEEVILLVFDTRLHFDNTKAFYNVTVTEQVIIVAGYAFGILFTYSVFIMRYIDPYVKTKIRLLLRLEKPDPADEDLSLPLVINDEMRISAIIPRRKLSPIYRRISEAVKSVDQEAVPTEVQVQEDLKKGYIGSIVVGIAYLVSKVEGIIERLNPEELDAVNVKFEKTEKLYIGEEQLQQGCSEMFDVLDRLKILIYEGYLSVPSINLLIKMLERDRDMLGELKKSFEVRRNADGLRQGLRQEARNLFFYTFDKRFLVQLIRENKTEAFRKFTLDLFMYQQETNKESCIEHVVGTFQFSPSGMELLRNFILIRNRFQEANSNLEEAIELKGEDVRSMSQRTYVEKIKGLVRKASEVQTTKQTIIKDIEFLSKCGLYDYSLIFSLYKPGSGWTLSVRNEDTNDIENGDNGDDVERTYSTLRFGKFSIGNLLKIKHNGDRKKPREYERRMKKIVEVLFGKDMASVRR